ASLLRANAAEVGIDPAFEVLDEIDATIMQDEAIQNALTHLIADDPSIAPLFSEYGVQSISYVLRSVITSADSSFDPVDDYFVEWEALYLNTVDQIINDLRNDPLLAEALDWQPPIQTTKGKSDK